VVTGCAHPGIANIVETAVQLMDRNVYLVVGGFHLGGAAREEILSVVEGLRSLGVTVVAPLGFVFSIPQLISSHISCPTARIHGGTTRASFLSYLCVPFSDSDLDFFFHSVHRLVLSDP